MDWKPNIFMSQVELNLLYLFMKQFLSIVYKRQLLRIPKKQPTNKQNDWPFTYLIDWLIGATRCLAFFLETKDIRLW